MTVPGLSGNCRRAYRGGRGKARRANRSRTGAVVASECEPIQGNAGRPTFTWIAGFPRVEPETSRRRVSCPRYPAPARRSKPSCPARGSGVSRSGRRASRKLLMSWSPTARAARQTANSPSGRSSVTLASNCSPAAVLRPIFEPTVRFCSRSSRIVKVNQRSRPTPVAAPADRERCASPGSATSGAPPVDRRGQRQLGELSFKVDDRRHRQRDLALCDSKLFLCRSSLAFVPEPHWRERDWPPPLSIRGVLHRTAAGSRSSLPRARRPARTAAVQPAGRIWARRSQHFAAIFPLLLPHASDNIRGVRARANSRFAFASSTAT